MGLPENKVREIIKIAQEPVSLETPIGEEEDSHLGDFIADDSAPLRIKADENSAVQWFTPDAAIAACSEPWMRPVYQRLNERMKSF